MRKPSPLPDTLAAAPFTVQKAAEAGVSAARLRASDLINPFRGVRVPLSLLREADDDQRFVLLLDAYQAKLPRGWFFSGPTAARILGVPLPKRLERPEVHVTAPGAFAPRGGFLIGHTADAATTTRMFGRRIRVPAELRCELASVLDLDELITAGDRLLSDKPILLTTRGHLEAAVAAHGSRRGARRLRAALPELREDVWSPRETWTRLILLRAGFPEPERNHRIHGPDGRLIAIGDLVYPKLKIVIEYEGERWHRDRWSGVDVDRYNALNAAGWLVVRIRKQHSAADVVRMVGAALRARGQQV
ncbi:MAG: endonuclease domain-containing protein [Microbacteriaceae bacterium]|nr:endonuclease domain-containing protein [Microbacteriaceae bacterium]